MRKLLILILLLLSIIFIGLTIYKLANTTIQNYDYDSIYIDTSKVNIHLQNDVLSLVNENNKTFSFPIKDKTANDFLDNFFVSGELLVPKNTCKYFNIEIDIKNINNDKDLVRYISCKDKLENSFETFSL